VLAFIGTATFWAVGPGWLILFYLLAFGATILGCISGRRRTGVRGVAVGFLVGHVYMLYTWLLWPVLLRAAGRQLRNRRDWSKTEREPIELESAAATAAGTLP
jgi:1,2-diacylglycerol 3-beta-glucosyltransferase